jgi:hypothetical protein
MKSKVYTVFMMYLLKFLHKLPIFRATAKLKIKEVLFLRAICFAVPNIQYGTVPVVK